MLGYNKLLKDNCLYEHYDDLNKYNEKTYLTPVNVKCFVSYDFINTQGYTEQSVTLNKIVFIGNDFIPDPFDKIDGLEVKKIVPVKGLITRTIGWQIYL